jgi:hypothetical protein
LSTRINLHAKHVVDDDQCQRCAASVEDRHHVFFGCSTSSELWEKIGLSHIATMTNVEVWNAYAPAGLDAALWPFILLTILWRLWDDRNDEIFQNETSRSRLVISRVCDDLVIWRKRLKHDHVNGLDGWRTYLVSCITTVRPN